MKSRFSKLIVFMLIFVIVLSMSSLAFASDLGEETYTEVVDSLRSNDKGLMGPGAMDTIKKISRDIFNIVRYVVIAILVIKAFGYFSQFSNAADDPRLKASLKAKLLWTAGGIILALNFWNLYKFIADISITLG